MTNPNKSNEAGGTMTTTEQAMREAFEADAVALGFDVQRDDMPTMEPWSEYVDQYTGHRWAGFKAAQASIATPQKITANEAKALFSEGGGLTDADGCLFAVSATDLANMINLERSALIEPLSAADETESKDCPHAAPFRYCAECVVTPCPIGLGVKK